METQKCRLAGNKKTGWRKVFAGTARMRAGFGVVSVGRRSGFLYVQYKVLCHADYFFREKSIIFAAE